jgi:hypothetical protein
LILVASAHCLLDAELIDRGQHAGGMAAIDENHIAVGSAPNLVEGGGEQRVD